jgi:ribosome biogenesis GTPase
MNDDSTRSSSEGIVLRAGRGLYTVQTSSGRVLNCALRGNLKKNLTYPESTNRRRRVEKVKKLRETDPIAVGDRVEVSQNEEEAAGRGMIEAVHPRRAALARRSGNERERQTLVANLELAVVTFAAAEPRPDLWKLDRFLVLAEDAELNILIVLNKADRATSGEIEEIAAPYREIGYDVLATCAKTGQGIPELRERLENRISPFAGRRAWASHRSSTRFSRALNSKRPTSATSPSRAVTPPWPPNCCRSRLAAGSPTRRACARSSFGIWTRRTWPFCFPEMAPLMGQCKFADCRHREEPGCAIRAAVERGEIDARRYESYREMTK